jgi:hypothetical protein
MLDESIEAPPNKDPPRLELTILKIVFPMPE